MRTVAKLLAMSLMLGGISTAALADIEVSFREGAPKDHFTIRNLADCPLRDATIEIDLSGSKAGLVFDTTATGAGVEVFQPFEIVSGGDALVRPPRVSDGDTRVILPIKSLAADAAIAFTIDVDDTTASREITVSNAEFTGVRVSVASDALGRRSAEVGVAPRVTVTTSPCGS